MDLNAQESPESSKVQEVSVEVVSPSKPKRVKTRPVSLKRATKAKLYKQTALMAGDLPTAARRLGIAYTTLYTSAQKHGWLSKFKSNQATKLKKELETVSNETLSPEMSKAWQCNQVHRSIKHSEKLDRVFDQVEDPAQLNQVQKALDSVDVRARKALGLDKNDAAQVNTMVQVNLHTS